MLPTEPEHSPNTQRPRVRVSGCLVLGILLLLLAACGIAVLIAPAVSEYKRVGMRIRSLENQREIARALRIYAGQNDTYFPPAEHWKQDLIEKARLDDSVFESPFMERVGGSYWYVPGGQFSPLQHDDPAKKRILLYSDPKWYWGEGGHIIYTTGRFEYVQNPRYLEIINALTIPDGTPYAPHLDD